jgi:uncharacterized alkaline shock family protein YloU
MNDKKLTGDTRQPVNIKKVDTKEFELPETLFVSDIDTKVIQGIVLQCLSNISDISLVAGNFIDNILGRGGPEVGSGIHTEQDSTNHSVNIKIEVNIRYGISIPEKAEEIQSKVVEEITRLTGLRVASVHVLFKNIIPQDQTAKMLSNLEQLNKQASLTSPKGEDEYSDEF